jgi:hypothetical protein
MENAKWGHCKSCTFFASPARVPLGSEEARCHHPELSRYHLTIFGACGCSGWELREGLPKTIEEQPTPA